MDDPGSYPCPELPMAEPEFYPSGHIRYRCPLGCGWFFWMMTPRGKNMEELLDRHMALIKETMSNHYKRNHGIEDA